MKETPRAEPTRTPWHRLLARVLELTLTPVGVSVETEFPIMAEPPKVDIVLLRREGDAWTEEQRALLPDGLRHVTARYIIIEFK
ncbi:MAG: hypothetical protein R3A44_26760 [Caldilineaceae bacterium]